MEGMRMQIKCCREIALTKLKKACLQIACKPAPELETGPDRSEVQAQVTLMATL